MNSINNGITKIFNTDTGIDIEFLLFCDSKINRSIYIMYINKLINDIEKAIIIEESLYRYSIYYILNNKLDRELINNIYINKFIDIYDNIDENSAVRNNYLKNAIINNIINIDNIAFLHPKDIFPDKWKYIINKEEMKKHRENNVIYTDSYKCRKCHKRKCSVVPQQTRSMDEPMTLFITCVHCGNQFKIN